MKLARIALAALLLTTFTVARASVPASPTLVKQGPAMCLNPSALDGGVTATYCLQQDAAGDLQTTTNTGAGASGTVDNSVINNMKLGKGVVPAFSALNGTAPTSTTNPFTCERVQYVIASNTVAAADAGFVRGAFNAAPKVIGIVVDATDGGAWIGTNGTGCTTATNGLTCTASANVTTTLGVTICGN
jgi:hypothetical protein